MPRQTPRNDFGTVLAHAAHQVVSKGAGLVGGMIPSGPILSAAVSSTKMAVSSVVPMGATTTSAASTSAAGASLGTPTGNGDAWDLLEAQKALSADGQKFNAAYLQLQNEMQRESREHNAVSNIMKVRHDSAKAAINNIR
ncbi:hypothetical protein HUA74_01365 [Myxococcus sp. CA051A]|uniref:hypothetical protein n=2 Tax=Myxococcaceae TaxID=31 RepID=UPI00157AA757|nr:MULTISPECIES: hypothetical protein [unclassified Myxococcus]NTX00720.1 hypothetical protein [Myxococcus sp. CA040A]NTX12575.1 hypothetical protein [Myxococcus sp. CA056]NTX33594.1 hypothetical protein [Myxococcus sp. CA033]NTX59299.1 hypothetical protein [Myxococcus sp. CA051A]